MCCNYSTIYIYSVINKFSQTLNLRDIIFILFPCYFKTKQLRAYKINSLHDIPCDTIGGGTIAPKAGVTTPTGGTCVGESLKPRPDGSAIPGGA